jgi:hypothetical protein
MERHSLEGLVYGEDITLEDVKEIESFLSARIVRLRHADRGSDERQAARAIHAALLYLVGTLDHALPLTGAASAATETRALLRREVRTCWNTLWSLASPWQIHAEYDRDRFRRVKYWDAEHAEEIRALWTRSTGSVGL